MSTDAWGERMPRSLGIFNVVAVSVGVTIGSGIFRVPATVAAQLADPGSVILCWVVGGLIALCGALSLAELAAALRHEALERRLLIAALEIDPGAAGEQRRQPVRGRDGGHAPMSRKRR